MHAEAQNVIDEALKQAVKIYLYACERAEAARLDPSDQNKTWDERARERNAGAHELLGALLDAYGYDVRMPSPKLDERTGENLGETFIQWTKTEREVVKYGYLHGMITREHMLAWYDHHQENGWLRKHKQPVPAEAEVLA